MSTPGLDGIYVGPADLSLALGKKPSFDNPEGSPQYKKIVEILEHAKKNKIAAGIHNATPEYAQQMIDIGFNFVSIGSDQSSLSTASKLDVSKLKKIVKKDKLKTY